MTNLLITLQAFFSPRRDDERGVTAVEYGLMVAFIAGAIVFGAQALGTNLNALFQNAATYLGTINF